MTDDQLKAEFRDVMASVCTPVSIASAMDGERPHGTTVSAFASLSMTPPMVLVSLDRGSDLLGIVSRTGRFSLNVLAAEQSELALAFARKGDAKFADVRWSVDRRTPRIDGVTGWLCCRVADIVEGGDHLIVLGEVEAASNHPGAPLTYHARVFGTHHAHAGATS